MVQRASAGDPVRTWVLGAVIYAAILLMVVGIFQLCVYREAPR